jgi:hypothetical protein
MSWIIAAVVLIAAVGLWRACGSASLPESPTTARTSVAPDSARTEPGEAAADGSPLDASSPDGANCSGEAERGAERAEDHATTNVSGVVLDDRGEPVANARIFAITRYFATSTGTLWRPRAVTEASGRFEGVVRTESLRGLIAEADGFEPGVVLVVGDGAVVEIRLRRLLRILCNVVDDATGERINRATARLHRVLPSGERAERGLGFEAKNGLLVMADLPPGRYAVVVSLPDHELRTIDDIRLSRDEPDAALDVRMRQSAPWGAVMVTVRDASGKPVEDLDHVLLHNPGTGFLTMSCLGSDPPISLVVPGTPLVLRASFGEEDDLDLDLWHLWARKRADSPVRLESPEGRHVLQILKPGNLQVTRIVDVVRGSETKVSVALQRSAHLRVVASDTAGEPVTGFRLALIDGRGQEHPYDLRNTFGQWGSPGSPMSPGPRMNRVIPTCAVEFRDLPSGRYRVTATKDGFEPAEALVDVVAPKTSVVRLTLR